MISKAATGNLSTNAQLVDGNPANDRETFAVHDWRNRVIETTNGDGTNTFIQKANSGQYWQCRCQRVVS